MYIKNIWIILIVLWSAGSKAQYNFNVNLTTGDSVNADVGFAVIELSNSNFLACGTVSGMSTTYSGSNLIKTKANGDTVWKKQYDFAPNIGGDLFVDVLELPDKNYLVLGATYDSIIQNGDICLAKIDTNGVLMWLKKFTHLDYDQPGGMQLTSDNKIIIVGNSSPNPNTTYNNILLIKTDINGNLIWRKTFGDSYDEIYESISLIKNNTEYLLGGRHGYSSSGNDYYDMSIMRTDTAGNMIWQQQYGAPMSNETSGCVIPTLDSGFVISGTYNNSGALVKVDKNGAQKWFKNYGFPTDSYIRSVKQLPDSSLAFIISYTYAPTNNSFTGFLNKADKNGNLIWQRVYPGPMTIPNFFFGFNTTSDGGFIITGQYNHIGQPYQNLWLVKTDSLGCDSVICSYITDIKEIKSIASGFKVFPNPNSGNFKILLDENNQSEKSVTVSISNLLGQVVYTKTINSDTHSEMEININNLKGVYIITITQSNKNIGQSKLIIE